MDETAADAENNFVGLSGELQGDSRRRLLTRSRMSKRNFERKLTRYSTRRMEGLCANTHTYAGEALQVTHLSSLVIATSSIQLTRSSWGFPTLCYVWHRTDGIQSLTELVEYLKS